MTRSKAAFLCSRYMHVERGMQGKQATADFKGGEVCAQQDDALALAECRVQMFQPVHTGESL